MKLLAILRDVASAAEGAVATASSSDPSGDFPPSGAIDRNVTHLNYGPASGAENGKGKGGWKSSGDSAVAELITTAGDFTGGIQTRVIDVGDAVQLAFKTSAYEQDMDPLTSGSALRGQDLWVDGGGDTASQNVETAAAFGGTGNGVRCLGLGIGTVRDDSRPVTFGATVIISFRVQQAGLGGVGSRWSFGVTAGGTVRYLFGIDEAAGPGFFAKNDGTTWSVVDTKRQIGLGNFQHVVLEIERSTPASSVAKIWIDGKQVDQLTVDTTGIDAVLLSTTQGTTATPIEFFFDELRIGDAFEDDGTQENVFDLGSAPSDGDAELVYNGENERVEEFIAGAFYGMANTDADRALRDAAASTEIAQTFAPTVLRQVDSVWLEVQRVGTPVGNLWLEIRSADAGLPSTITYARSTSISIGTLGTISPSVQFQFPFPFTPVPNRQYAFVLVGDFPISGANHIIVRVDASAAGYGGGQSLTFDGATWMAITTEDWGFVAVNSHTTETEYDETNQDTDCEMGRSSANYYLAQSFKVPHDVFAQHFQVFVKVPTGVTFDPNDRWWAEVHKGIGPGEIDAVEIRDVEQIEKQIGISVKVNGACFDIGELGDSAVENGPVGWSSVDPVELPASLGLGGLYFANQMFTPDETVNVGTVEVRLAFDSTVQYDIKIRLAIYETEPSQFGYPVPTTTLVGVTDFIRMVDLVRFSPGPNTILMPGGSKSAAASTFTWYDQIDMYEKRLVFNFEGGALGAAPLIAGRTYALVMILYTISAYQPSTNKDFNTAPVYWVLKQDPLDSLRADVEPNKAFPMYYDWTKRDTGTFGIFSSYWLSRSIGLTKYHFTFCMRSVDSFIPAREVESISDEVPPSELTWVQYDPSALGAAGGAYQWWTMSLPVEFLFRADVTYYMVVRNNWLPSATKFLHLGCDTSAPTYPDGVAYQGDDADPHVWTTLAGTDLIFRLLGPHRPFVRWDVDYSTDDGVTDPYVRERLSDSALRVGSQTITWQGQKKQFWRMRGEFIRKRVLDKDLPWTPVMFDYRLTVKGVGSHQLFVDFLPGTDATRVISGFEVYAHPFEGGLRRLTAEGKTTDAGAFTILKDIDIETLAARQKGGGATVAHNFAQVAIAGASYALSNNDSDANVRDVAANTQIAQTITPSISKSVQTIDIQLRKVGSPVGDIILEIRSLVGGDPSGVVLAESDPFEVATLQTFDTTIRFNFQQPFVNPSGVQYGLVMVSNVPISATDFFVARVDTSAPTYAGGQHFTFDGTTWTAVPGTDWGFVTNSVEDSGELILNGDYLFCRFRTDKTLTDFKLNIAASGTDAARVIKLRVFRIVDMGRRVITMNLNANAESDFRTPKAKRLKLVLQNLDHHLSVFRTESDYSDQLGAGIRFLAYKELETAPAIRLGEFYVTSKWREDPDKGTVTVQCKDMVHLMNRLVQPKLRVGFHKDQIMEYLANLCDIPSQNLILDRSSGIVDFFAAKEVNAWNEMKVVAQAAGFGDVGVENSYLEYRATGNSGMNTRLGQLTGLGVVLRVQGPTAIDDDFFWLVYVQNASDKNKEDLKLVKYNVTTLTWSVETTVETGMAAGRGGLLTTQGDDVIILNFPTGTGSAVHQGTLYDWDGVTLTTQAVIDFGPNVYQIPGQGSTVRNDWTSFKDDFLWRICLGDAATNDDHGVHDINLLTNEVTVRPAPAANTRVLAITKEGIDWIVVTSLSGGVLKFQEWDPIADIYTDRGTLSANGTTALFGLARTQKGYVYASSVGDGTPVNAGVIDKLTVPGFVLTSTAPLSGEVKLPFHTGSALVFVDQLVLTVISRSATGGPVQSFLVFEEDTGSVVEYGDIEETGSILASSIGQFRAVSTDSRFYINGTLDGTRVFEFAVRMETPRTRDPTVLLSDGHGSPLLGISLETSGLTADQDHIINLVIIRAQPLGARPKELQWEGSDLPWGITEGNPIRFPFEFTDPCLPSTIPPIITFIAGGAATVTVKHVGLQRARMEIIPTATGGIETIYVERQPLRSIRTIISAVGSSDRSAERFQVRTKKIDNPYIFDAVNATIVAGSILARMESPYVRLRGVAAWSLWNIRRFDRVRVTDSRTGLLDQDFYVVAYGISENTEKARLKLVKVKPRL